MPETYTQEQIHNIATALYGWTALPRILPSAPGTGPDWDIGADIRAILSALSTAERERDENKSKAEQYYKDWYASKAEFSDITAKLRDRVRTAEARCAELEARLQGAGKQWETFARKIWGSGRVMNVEQFVAEGLSAIVSKKEG